MKKKWSLALVLLILLILLLCFFYIFPSLRIATGYAAKYTCSYTFLSDFEHEKIKSSFNFFPVNKVSSVIDRERKMVIASLFGIAERKAYYYEHGRICGCVLDNAEPVNNLLKTAIAEEPLARLNENKMLRFLPDSLSSLVNRPGLEQLLQQVLDTNASTLAITIAYKNYLVAEKYAKGVDTNTRLLGWSMTKSVLNALFGILEKNGMIRLDETALYTHWNNDERKEIALNNLLQMSSGLKWDEEYSVKTDVTQMLYLQPDVVSFSVSKQLEHPPGEKWYYSSGTTNILSGILRKKFQDDRQYLLFPFDSLFDVIGMHQATVELDNTGNYIYSSYAWATAREWTKFGLMYLNKGSLFGAQVFTPEWADYSIEPAKSSEKKYGAQLWLKPSDPKFSAVPEDGFFANGYGGQKILVLPSKEMVIVILSSRQENGFDYNTLYAKIMENF